MSQGSFLIKGIKPGVYKHGLISRQGNIDADPQWEAGDTKREQPWRDYQRCTRDVEHRKADGASYLHLNLTTFS
jgi:hypothetical protein